MNIPLQQIPLKNCYLLVHPPVSHPSFTHTCKSLHGAHSNHVHLLYLLISAVKVQSLRVKKRACKTKCGFSASSDTISCKANKPKCT